MRHAVALRPGQGLPAGARQSEAENAVGCMVALAPVLRAAVGTATTRTENGLGRRSRSVGGGPRAVIRQAGGNMTISKTGNPIAPSTNGRPAPVRVKLQRINAGFAKAHPPNGQGKVWWARLHKALGTSSSAFVNASLLQLQQAACLRGGSISEIGVNSALALIEADRTKKRNRGRLGAANGLHPHRFHGHPGET